MGRIGIPVSELDRMSLRECFNAIEGYTEFKRSEYAALFEIARFGSFYNVFSNDQMKALKRAKNPYMDNQPKSKGVDPLKIGDMLSGLAKGFNNGET